MSEVQFNGWWKAVMEDHTLANARRKLSFDEIARIAKHARNDWRDIATVPTDDTLFLAACDDGRIMIWRGTLLATALNDRTPDHLQFPATKWMPMPHLKD